MKHIIIVGSGPVGSFMAVLCRQLHLQVTVYEKRYEFTRNINLKINSDLFQNAQNVITRLGVNSDFFEKLYRRLQTQKDRILIKELEENFTEEAKTLGANYILREVKSFTELMTEHGHEDYLILDCTGRNSELRRRVFGDDKGNVVTTPLQNAMYINFRAIIRNDTSLYQVMKNVPGIKLTEVVVSKNKDSDGFTNVTIPVFITSGLARHFDADHPNINRQPLNPFNSLEPVSDSIFFPISSIIGNLLVDECCVDLNSVKVKKIVISCGYSKQRSMPNFICLGDSAVHLAFFRSLNLGLKHALELFVYLSMSTKNPFNDNPDFILEQFQANNPFLNPVEVYPSVARNVYFVVTKVLWYGCFLFCTTNQTTQRLTDVTGRTKKEIYALLTKHNEKLSKWGESLKEFEANREEDIKSEISSNKFKNVTYDFTSLFVDINGKSVLKISEVLRAVNGKQSLYRADFDFFLRCFKARREVFSNNVGKEINDFIISIVHNFLNQLDNNNSPVLKEIQSLCTNKNLSIEEKLKIIVFTINNELKKSELKLNLELVEKTVGLWPKLVGLRFDGSEVRLNITLTLIKNEIRGCTRLFSNQKMAKNGDLAGTSETGLYEREKAASNDNLLADWYIVRPMQNALKKSGRYRSHPNLLVKGKQDELVNLCDSEW